MHWRHILSRLGMDEHDASSHSPIPSYTIYTILLLSHSIHSIHSIRLEGKIVDRLRRRAPDAGRCHFEMVQLHEEGMEHLKAADSWARRWKMMDNPRTWDFHGENQLSMGDFPLPCLTTRGYVAVGKWGIPHQIQRYTIFGPTYVAEIWNLWNPHWI